MLAVVAGKGCLTFFFPCHITFLSPVFCESARYRLKYCLKDPFNPRQPISKIFSLFMFLFKINRLNYYE